MLSQYYSYSLDTLNPITDSTWGQAGLVLQETANKDGTLILNTPFHDIHDAFIPIQKKHPSDFTKVPGLGFLVHFEDGTALVASLDNTEKPWHGKNSWTLFPWAFRPGTDFTDVLETALLSQDDWPKVAQDPTQTRMPPVWNNWVIHPSKNPSMLLGALRFLGVHTHDLVAVTGQTFFDKNLVIKNPAEKHIRLLLKHFGHDTSFICQKTALEIQGQRRSSTVQPDTLIIWNKENCPFETATHHEKMVLLKSLQLSNLELFHANTSPQP